jgi:purine-binding chemotaxis protein CheW
VTAAVGERPDTSEVGARYPPLLDELRTIELERLRIGAGLAALGPGARLPGLHLVAKVSGRPLLVPGTRIAEVARVVACDPIPGAAAWILGSFVWRGQPAVAVDVGLRLGGTRAASIDAMMVILDGAPAVALVVEDVGALAEDPILCEHDTGGPGAGLWVGSCRVGDEALPLLAPEALEREVRRVGLVNPVEVRS